MKTDRELLVLAAKAAGIEALRAPDGVMRDCTGMPPMMNIFAGKPWNPLTDDADALRLAVKLKLRVNVREHDTRAYNFKVSAKYLVEHNDDPYAATRKVIVMAAAAIGEASK